MALAKDLEMCNKDSPLENDLQPTSEECVSQAAPSPHALELVYLKPTDSQVMT